MEKRKTSYLSRYGLAFIMVAVLFFCMQLMVHATDEEGQGTATVKAGKQNVNVRATAVDGGSVAHVSGGDTFTVLGSVNGSDGYTWYEISGSAGGTNIHGYIREDMVDVTEAAPADGGEAETGESGGEDAAPADGGGDMTPESNGTMGSILAMDPPVGEDGSVQTPALPAGFDETRIRVGDREVQAWEKDDTFYIFYANSPSGNVGWFLYDAAEGRWVRYTDFLLENGGTAAEPKAAGGVSKGVVIALIILVVILALACAFMAYKLFAGKDYADDDDDDDDDEDYRPRRQVNTRPAAPANGHPVQSRPQGAAQGQRPAGAGNVQRQPGQRPAGARPAGAPQGQRPAGARPAGAPGQRPAGARPAGAPGQQPVRRQSQPGAPVRRAPQQGGAVRPQARQSRPVDDEDDE